MVKNLKWTLEKKIIWEFKKGEGSEFGALPNSDQPFVTECDASTVAVEAVLKQHIQKKGMPVDSFLVN